MYDATDDPYTYENSTVLINKLNLREQAKLDDFEAEITNARAGEPLPSGSLNFAHFCAISSSSVSRSLRLGRHSTNSTHFEAGATHSASPSISIPKQAKLFADLKAAHYFEGLPAKDFAERAAHFLAELNAIHVFREGNGRTQLTFFAMLGRSCRPYA